VHRGQRCGLVRCYLNARSERQHRKPACSKLSTVRASRPLSPRPQKGEQSGDPEAALTHDRGRLRGSSRPLDRRRTFFVLAALNVGAGAEEVSGPARIKDADLEVAGKTFRLHGIDGPEFDNACLDDERPPSMRRGCDSGARQVHRERAVR
jgi:hypothetical protein